MSNTDQKDNELENRQKTSKTLKSKLEIFNKGINKILPLSKKEDKNKNVQNTESDKDSDKNNPNKMFLRGKTQIIDEKNTKENIIKSNTLNENNNEEGINKKKNFLKKNSLIQGIFHKNKNDAHHSEKTDQEKQQKQKENENDEEEDELFKQIASRTRSKKIVNHKVISTIDEHKEHLPNFTAECKFYGEGKERYKVKIIIDSNFSLVFLPEKKNNFRFFNSNYYRFPLFTIKKYLTTKKNKKFVIDLILKDYRSFSFKLTEEDFNRFNDVMLEFGMPNQSIKYFHYAYYYYTIYSKEEKTKNHINGWTIYKEENEFKNQELDFKNKFRIIDNSKFDFCSSYPKKLVVPISMTDEDMKECGSYRTKERFPALTYRYKNGKCIWRSSQTKSGIKGKKNNKDVFLLTKIAEGSPKLIVFDARPMLNAWANKLKGAGYEDISQYSEINMELIFCGIPNIHAVRGSCHKVYSTVCFKNEKKEEQKSNKKTESGNWYDAINIIIKKGFQIAEEIKNGNTVLIHCSDGWDRTTQLSCTSQLILDKRFRTLDGFICLVEKDFLGFGHQFRYRCGMYSPSDSPSNITGENQKSPIFIQWLDAVYQIMCQNMTKFEFNTELLFFLANEIYSGKYGTFLFNNENEREQYNAREKTISIWSYVKDNEIRFLNPIYNPDDNLPLTMNYKRIQLWNKYFFRFEDGENCFEETIIKAYNNLNNSAKKDKEIINELVNFINKKCSGKDINSLSEDCKNLIKKSKNKK